MIKMMMTTENWNSKKSLNYYYSKMKRDSGLRMMKRTILNWKKSRS